MKTLVTPKIFTVLFVSLIVLVLFSCKKDEFPDPSLLPKGLEGSWVEVNTKTDTIIFKSNSDTGMFYLHRGYEIRNGYRLPIIGSTPYHYEIFTDSIKVIDGLSSSWNEGTYDFNFDNTNLT